MSNTSEIRVFQIYSVLYTTSNFIILFQNYKFHISKEQNYHAAQRIEWMRRVNYDV